MKQIRVETGICHLRVAQESTLKEFLLHSDLSPLPLKVCGPLIDEWLRFGSVYVDGLRTRADQTLKPQQLIRLHTRRKTYVAHPLTLSDRLIFQNEDFLVLDKPAGLPTHPTLDNYLENAKVMLENELGIPIYVTHRLDVATQGLLLMAKSKNAQAQINKLFSKRKVEKFYRCLTDKPLTPGRLEHFMDMDSRIPKSLEVFERPGLVNCLLEILSCKKSGAYYLSEIRLLTGRTHQIRAQLSFVGAPIVGDKAYGSPLEWPAGIALECSRLSFLFSNFPFDFEKKQPVPFGPGHSSPHSPI